MGLLCGLNATPTSDTPSSLNRPTPSPSPSAHLTVATSTTTKPLMSNSQTSKQRSVHNDPRENVDVQTESEATNNLQKAFKKHYSANSEGKFDADQGEGIMELMNGGNAAKTSPVLTIKRGGRNAGQWQDFIDREQSSVDQLIRDSFAVFCKDLHDDDKSAAAATMSHSAAARYQRRNSSESRANMSSLPRTNKMFLAKSFSNGGGGTLPRTPPKLEGLVTSSPRVPRGIEELEMLYAPMKNLSMPLPNARKYSGTSMPQPHPLVDWRNELQIVEDFERRKSCDDDQVRKMVYRK